MTLHSPARFAFLSSFLFGVACSSPPNSPPSSNGEGGQTSNGSGGASALGGATNAAGGSANGFGGSANGGANSAAGGATASGGSASGGVPAGGSSAGGSAPAGGATTSGGTNSGGSPAAGGALSGGSSSGGAQATGGRSSGGNSSASGGVTASGGAATSGGVSASGGAATGGAGTGGAGGAVAACATNQIATCTGTNPIACHFGGNPGNYEVTVELGGSAAGNTYVEAEAYRRMLGVTTTAAGERKRFSFVVNVRQPEGEPIQAVPAGTAGLDLYFYGTAPTLASICQRSLKPVVVYVAGDSTVCDQTSTDYSGWAQHLPQHFLSPVSIANYSDSGESSSSFLNSGNLWGAIKSRVTTGDWVMIQFGHNDKTTDEATFRANLTKMVNDAKAAGASPILFTPISRVGYTLAEEHVNSVGVNLPAVVKSVGSQLGVPVIDLTTTTWNWLQTITWQDYFALGTDRTHTNPKGADVISGFVRDGVRAQAPNLAKYLR
ncbi:MAG: hypothetical protein QM756_27275 [Polyangiaceae bacterium]